MEKEALTELSRVLYEKLFARFPDWKKYAEFLASEYDIEKKSLYVKIPSPVSEKHFLSVLERGDYVEISYCDENPQTAAQIRVICEQDRFCVEVVIEFIEEIIDEKVVVGQKSSFFLLGKRRSLLRFINLTESKNKKFINIYSWHGSFNKTTS